jgi:acyl transferase domain-containing protein
MGVPLVRFGVFIPSVERFDANAFGLSDVEAQLMDPSESFMFLFVQGLRMKDCHCFPTQVGHRIPAAGDGRAFGTLRCLHT